MLYEELVRFVQAHFTDGLVLVIGSGLSAAEGIPGMVELADHLGRKASELAGADAALWSKIQSALDAKRGLEAALVEHVPSDSLEVWITQHTCGLLLPKERHIIGEVIHGKRSLRLTTFLARILKPATGLPILTPNYDRLVELACEMAGLHVDTTATGTYAGAFDHSRSCLASARGITRSKPYRIEHTPRAIVLKPHGSFDWFKCGDDARRCSVDIDGERLIITPGLNKFRFGYDSPFDKHRELANEHIRRAARFLIVGYGFNDPHLQVHLRRQIAAGLPTLILNRSINDNILDLTAASAHCVCLSKPPGPGGVTITANGGAVTHTGPDLWDLGVLTRELLA